MTQTVQPLQIMLMTGPQGATFAFFGLASSVYVRPWSQSHLNSEEYMTQLASDDTDGEHLCHNMLNRVVP